MFLSDWTKNYKKMSYIDMSIKKLDGSIISFGDADKYRTLTKQKADECGWEYDEISGDIRLIEKLINGDWNSDEFLIVSPEQKIIAANTDEIVSCE